MAKDACKYSSDDIEQILGRYDAYEATMTSTRRQIMDLETENQALKQQVKRFRAMVVRAVESAASRQMEQLFRTILEIIDDEGEAHPWGGARPREIK